MAAIQVRGLPEEIYTKLVQLSKAENRSLAQETIVILKKALDLEDDRKKLRRVLLKKSIMIFPIRLLW